MLFDVVRGLGIGGGHRVLDVGCRDGRHAFELARRFGCCCTGIELVRANLERGLRLLDAARRDEPEVAARVDLVQGRAEALPFADATFDLVWVRDVLIHVPDLSAALRECRRVVAPSGHVLVFQMFATPWLEPGEAARLWPALAAIPRNTDPSFFEEALDGAGLRQVRREEIGSEWRERAEEDRSARTSTQLLHAARLIRDRERLRGHLGAVSYDVELADCLWGVYQMIGKLSARVYLLAPV
jgi:SAM-dependent methyltransferase